MSPAPSSAALLEPTLATGAPTAPLLSPRATFLTSFFGGPWAALVVGVVNLARCRRLRQDAWVVGAAALLGVAALAIVYAGLARPELLEGIVGEGFRTATLVRRATNLLGVAAWGLFYLRLRPRYRAAEVTGEFASPWRVAVPALAGAMALHALVAFVVAGLLR